MNSEQKTFSFKHSTGVLLLAAWCISFGVPAVGQTIFDDPPQLKGVDIEQNLDAQLPLDLTFTDENGKKVRLGDYFNNDKPVIITPVYYNCPQLCTLTLNGLCDSLNEVDLTPGVDFNIVTFSFNHREEVKLANAKRRGYLTRYDHPNAADGWHFHVGDKKTIRKLTDALGFKFNELKGGEEFAHGASIIICTPDGRISRYLNDIVYDPGTMRLSLVEASEGNIGSIWDQFILRCCVFDPEEGSYAASAMKIMRMGAGMTLLLIIIGLIVLKLRDPKRIRTQPTLRELPT